MTVRVACLQLCSTVDVEANWATFERLSLAAIAEGAVCIFTPENTFFLGAQFHKVALAQPLDGPLGQRCAAFAKEHGVYLFIGSMAEVHLDTDGNVDSEGVTIPALSMPQLERGSPLIVRYICLMSISRWNEHC